MAETALLARSPAALIDLLRERSLRRFSFIWKEDAGALVASHPDLQPLADWVAEDCGDFQAHEGVFCQVSRTHETLLGAFVHRTVRGQAAGGVRYWHYDTIEGYLRDGLRLAQGMTHKNALAGLWWGGGKGVMAHNPAVDKQDPAIRKALYTEYGELMSSLRGCYVTAEDVGTHVADMSDVFSSTRFTTCIPPELGGSGNPSEPTARGVVAGIIAALAHLGEGDLRGKTVVVQGAGNVGGPLLGLLAAQGVGQLVVSDIDRDRLERARAQAGSVPVETRFITEHDLELYATPCDVFAPCATGAVLNPRSIPRLKARVVCGAANNQLEVPDRDDAALAARGITYVPDFLTNRMGIVTCADEGAGYVPDDPMIERHLSKDWTHSIHRTTLEVLERAEASGRPPGAVALERADELSRQPHPIFGHRGYQIIRGLHEWARS